jgi:sugar lactone lactonase YvrE
MQRRQKKTKKASQTIFFITIAIFALFILGFFYLAYIFIGEKTPLQLVSIKTIAGTNKEFGEPFGIAHRNGETFFSDGEAGKIWKISSWGNISMFAEKLATPSGIAFTKEGDLIVADSGSHTIKSINSNGEVSILAGIENKSGFADGDSKKALFKAPIGVAIFGEKIFVADTYNDRIRVIEKGKVATFAGGEKGFADGEKAKFDTPCGIAVTKTGELIIADTGNRRLRVVQKDGKTFTFAGNGEQDLIDGLPLKASFVQPTALAISEFGLIYVADGNAIRVIGRRLFPVVETINNPKRGFADGNNMVSRINRPSGLAFDESGNLLIADSDNQVIRALTDGTIGSETKPETIAKMRFTAEEFRKMGEPRWTYNPPEAKREIAGTLGEVRGERTEIVGGKQTWFHNGLDVVGGYGETARFIRPEKVLRPIAAENFGGLRELLRMPTIGYIHLRLGRDKEDKSFDDARFDFETKDGKFVNVRIPRGTKFEAGDAIGTLNSFNHVHLIAGRSGAEMNAIDALVLPGLVDSVSPTIESVSLFDENWQPIADSPRIKLSGKTRITVRSFDQMDGNASRRKLGVYRLGYQILKKDQTPLSEPIWNVSFATMPDEDAVTLVYAKGSQSGYTPETIFDYIVSNEVNPLSVKENFFDASNLSGGSYILRVFSADFFGNTATKDIEFER